MSYKARSKRRNVLAFRSNSEFVTDRFIVRIRASDTLVGSRLEIPKQIRDARTDGFFKGFSLFLGRRAEARDTGPGGRRAGRANFPSSSRSAEEAVAIRAGVTVAAWASGGSCGNCQLRRRLECSAGDSVWFCGLPGLGCRGQPSNVQRLFYIERLRRRETQEGKKYRTA